MYVSDVTTSWMKAKAQGFGDRVELRTSCRPLVKSPARCGGTKFLKKGRLLLLLSEALQRWNRSRWERAITSTMCCKIDFKQLSNLLELQQTRSSLQPRTILLGNVQSRILLFFVSITVIQYFPLKSRLKTFFNLNEVYCINQVQCPPDFALCNSLRHFDIFLIGCSWLVAYYCIAIPPLYSFLTFSQIWQLLIYEWCLRLLSFGISGSLLLLLVLLLTGPLRYTYICKTR